MPFDLIRFFEQHRIDYSDHGPNISKGNVVIHCPFCGADDPSQHLSVSINGKGWRCLRRPDVHRGSSPARLIGALLGISLRQAHDLIGGDHFIPDDFMSRMNTLLRPVPSVQSTLQRLRLPDDFKSFRNVPSARPFIGYMNGRGFPTADFLDLAKQFDLRYATSGPFHHRIIFPIYHDDRLLNWTGRHIGKSSLRYRTLGSEPDREEHLPAALGPITDQLLWFDQCRASDASTLCLVEGPMDALKIWYLGQAHGIIATALFTMGMSAAQLDALYRLANRFERRILLLDRGTMPAAMRLMARLNSLRFQMIVLTDAKDPGELREWPQLRKIVS